MKKNRLKIITSIVLAISVILIGFNVCAHSGRTDQNGGHKDNQNKSGLGSYHYHCGGHPAHLHDGGVCPYSAAPASYSTSSVSSSESSTSTPVEGTKEETVLTSANAESKPVEQAPVKETTVKSTTIKEEPVKETIIKVESIKINENLTSMEVGESSKLTATITPENATDKNIVWESSDENIATVSTTGKIVALEPGEVKITAKTNDGKTDILEITVEKIEVVEEEIVAPIQSNEINNTSSGTSEDVDTVSGLLGLGVIGGGYWAYRKIKKSKKK